MHEDKLVRDDWQWRYSCTCGYVSVLHTKIRLELVQRIHRHRHLVGLAGVYHRRNDT